MQKSPAFQLYCSDFLMDLNVQMMTLEQRGSYITLLCHDWTNDGIPSSAIAQLSGLNCWDDDVNQILRDRFIAHPSKEGFLANPRLLKERTKQNKFSKERSKSGKAGAKKRWQDSKDKKVMDDGSAIAQPMANDSSSTSTSTSTSSSDNNTPIPPKRGRRKATGRVDKNTDWMIRIGKWFNRQESTLWSQNEANVLDGLFPTMDEFDILEKYYTTKIPQKDNFRRRDVATLLNNWNGEVDRAMEFNGREAASETGNAEKSKWNL